jgi:hypothetical protein
MVTIWQFVVLKQFAKRLACNQQLFSLSDGGIEISQFDVALVTVSRKKDFCCHVSVISYQEALMHYHSRVCLSVFDFSLALFAEQ